ncbi:methylated-DNA--[protein]-cysteine S-methyltransferase [Shinella sp. CPCC 101442]|uniref:methylated-DNA--[protein]-cysteine S-methyltransferase n=1 Tax=Shinella sp. CPCC 101442 TaxID=2932265 RepID=UPI0027E57F02|nr:methylated-DNA--[protein]-cysteine S-methyltransferase [Shinella sp. CPCC 101442]
MNCMIGTDTLRPDPLANVTPTAADVLSYAIADCELGKVLIARSTKGVCAILLGIDAGELAADLAARFPQSTLVASEAMAKDDVARVLRYIAKPANGLQLTLDTRGTPFQRRVWEKLQTIAVGRRVTYTELAHWLSPFSHPRAVAAACAANPIALAIPCHRVVRSNGALSGYRWGLERKRILIEKETSA